MAGGYNANTGHPVVIVVVVVMIEAMAGANNFRAEVVEKVIC
jgi:hypothetical protein